MLASDVPWGKILNKARNAIIFEDKVEPEQVDAFCRGVHDVLHPQGNNAINFLHCDYSALQETNIFLNKPSSVLISIDVESSTNTITTK